MKYYMIRLSFPYGVHFGETNIDDCNMTFHADTLFSALFIEAVKSGKANADRLLSAAQANQFVISDGFPYIGNTYYLPKPIIYIEKNEDLGNSVIKKTAKKLSYIPMQKMDEYIAGALNIKKEKEILDNLGKSQVKASVAIKGLEQTEPYYVGVYRFESNNGLYFFVGLVEEMKDLFFDLLDMLSFSGIGGKRSAGLGRFEVEKMIPIDSVHFNPANGKKGYLLLSTSFPTEDELEKALEGAEYLVQKRSGFVQSPSFALEQRKKCEQFFFKAGSRFMTPFVGNIYEVGVGGKHPIYRYGKAMFWTL